MTEHADQSLSFRIAGRDYALPLLQAREIVILPPLTRVPTTPPHILGVFNLVGRVVPVLDVAVKLGLGATAYDDRSCVVVADVLLEGETTVVGILVEQIGVVVDHGDVERLDLEALVSSRAADGVRPLTATCTHDPLAPPTRPRSHCRSPKGSDPSCPDLLGVVENR